MRLCFIAHQGTKEGAGLFMLDEIDYLVRRGVSVSAVVPWNGALAEALIDRGVEVAQVANPWWTKPRGLQQAGDYEETLRAARTMAALFSRWNIDIVYTETIVAPAGAFAAALAGLPHVWHIHEFSYNSAGIEMAIARPSLARLIDLTSNHVFFNSKVVAREWDGLLPSEKTRVVYNWTSAPVDDSPPRLADVVASSLLADGTSFIVAIVGSIIPLKRQRDAIESVGNLLREGFDVALLVVGPVVDPTYHTVLASLVQQNGWEQRVRFVGHAENPHAIMRRAGVTLVCSDGEAFGRVTVESMAQGTPVIGADSGGTAEIIEDGVDGLLFPPGDVAALTDRLRSILRDESLRLRLTDGAKKKAARFHGAESVMSPVFELLTALVGKSNPSWPLGILINAGFPDSASAERAARPKRDRGKRLLRRLLGFPR
jgi:glycosyltransferase involved in cell wall biosynthesis